MTTTNELLLIQDEIINMIKTQGVVSRDVLLDKFHNKLTEQQLDTMMFILIRGQLIKEKTIYEWYL